MKTYNQFTAIKVASLAATALAVTTGLSLAQGKGNGNGNGNNTPTPTPTPTTTTTTTTTNGNGNGNSSTPALIPTIPQGWLSAYPTIVQTGTKPTLTWSISYPSTVTSYATVTPPALVTTLDQVDVEVRVIGAGVTVGEPSTTNTNWVPTQAQIKVGTGNYVSIFMGTNDEVDPNKLVWAKRVNKDTEIRFGGRYYFGDWSTTYTSDNSNNIRILKNGEYPPTAYLLNTTDQLKSFMAPYLDGGGKIKIGPLDTIVMMELTQPESNANDPGYNLQDMVLLMTVKPKGNNGHGNNIDGVDSSNPGNAPFKQYDTDASIDDERK